MEVVDVLEGLSPTEIKQAVTLLHERNRLKRYERLDDYDPYWWQKEFHDAGKDNPERMLRAANRTGKTFCAAAEATYHATGLYPDWWEGKTFDHPVTIWASTVTNELSRDVQQKALVGGLGEELGTGAIPKNLIVGKPTKRQAGIGDVIDTVTIRHASGGESKIIFKAYEQGWRKFQGAEPDVVWLDEEPDDFRLYTECLTRILTSKGTLMVTFTPLIGQTDLVLHFAQPEATGVWMITASWDDAPHLDKDDKERMLASYPKHERDARTKGVPLMGAGRVFPIPEDEIVIPRFDFPPSYARICGIDFGVDHPFAAVWLAHDRDRDVIYIYDVYRVKDKPAPVHAEAINNRGHWIPVAWPHDGLQRGKADGLELHRHYRKLNVSLLSRSARYKNETGGAQPVEPIVMEARERMETGRLKVFSDCNEWLEEFRNFHRDDKGKIVAARDDAMKASLYALMMIRYATPRLVRQRESFYSSPII